ncbi:MAG: peptidoglycan editing factor PgeF [Gammaproteobacteria bacterium]|nr:peptidoglycan editing factor PgeF [Gammaproteobacteria bacterium]NNC56666.1 peptidoglycan editing factor PgeF [Woeseiaceae bacterium]NNL51369.1 peptidoglycan editing factor PgeF [Woeseiaceae bacterium]
MSDGWIAADWPAPAAILAGTTLRTGCLDAVGLPGDPCWLNQVHGVDVVSAGPYDNAPDADACVGQAPGDVCVVRTADCLPVLFCAADGTEIAAAHAGWRGLAAGVLEATVAHMSHAPQDLLVWMGPAISQPAFEVGDEVREAFVAGDDGAAGCFLANDRGRWQADLYALARRRLAATGVNAIYGGGFCTFADQQRFFSYRRDADCGRMISFVGINTLENSDSAAI